MFSGTVFQKCIPPQDRGYPSFGYERKTVEGLVFDKDVTIPLRDGVEIYGDLYRPSLEKPFPTLIAWSPYGKHGYLTVDMFPGSDINPDDVSPLFHFEGPDPAFWCKAGYAVLYVDPRGSWGSGGDRLTYWTESEARDYYDTIEWAAAQDWSTGRIGLAGQSYFSIAQWKVAALRPPHLACINVWGGFSDRYRDFARHGGIPETGFSENFFQLAGMGLGLVENMKASLDANAFDGSYYYKDREAHPANIEVPAYVVADWTDQGIHSRGTLEAYKQLTGPKWLEINGRKKWERYFQPEFRNRLLAFYDRFLKDDMQAISDWPPVRIEVRESFKQGNMRNENEWPLARTDYRNLFLNFEDGLLTNEAPVRTSVVEYEAKDGTIIFDYSFVQTTELTGYAKLRLWVEAVGSDDMDLFVRVDKVGCDGKIVNFPYITIFNNGAAALGWLRVSHRELDKERSTEFQPRLRHENELRLSQGEIVAVDIEILASSTVFEAGDTLRLTIGGHDLVDTGNGNGSLAHKDLRNTGIHRFHSSVEKANYVVLPFVS